MANDKEMIDFLTGVVGVCEATSCERHHIFERWSERVEWKENLCGLLETVGALADMPVCISLQTVMIDGRKILFWHPTSQVVDHRLIDKWLIERLPTSAFRDQDPRQGVNQADAMNFHIIVPFKAKAA